MQVELHHRPGNTVARFVVNAGESFTAEAGSMVAMSSNMDITTTTHKKSSGGLLKAAKRLFAGESFFLNHYECQQDVGEVWLGTALAGDLQVLDLQQQTLIVQAGSFLAVSPGIEVNVGWQGFKSLLSGENLFWLQLSGTGTVVISAFGAIYPIETIGEYIVDTGHIVAFDESLDFSITKAGKSWLHSFLAGEGMVCKFHGRGTIWCQSHNPKSFGSTLTPNLKVRSA